MLEARTSSNQGVDVTNISGGGIFRPYGFIEALYSKGSIIFTPEENSQIWASAKWKNAFIIWVVDG